VTTCTFPTYYTTYLPERVFGQLHRSVPWLLCQPLAYDGNKYVVCDVHAPEGVVRMTIKAGYLFRAVSFAELEVLEVDYETFSKYESGQEIPQ
jgi:hypothetical protein